MPLLFYWNTIDTGTLGETVMENRSTCSMSLRAPVASIALALLGTTTGYAQKYQVAVLENLPGSTSTDAIAINNAGQVVGQTSDASGNTFAVIWNGTKPTLILAGGRSRAYPYAVNNSGVVVGSPT
jgi:uncharacterized membrane protein